MFYENEIFVSGYEGKAGFFVIDYAGMFMIKLRYCPFFDFPIKFGILVF